MYTQQKEVTKTYKDGEKWVCMNGRAHFPMFEGYYFVDVEVSAPKNKYITKTERSIAVFEYKIVEGKDTWVYPENLKGKDVKLKAYKLPKIAMPYRKVK